MIFHGSASICIWFTRAVSTVLAVQVVPFYMTMGLGGLWRKLIDLVKFVRFDLNSIERRTKNRKNYSVTITQSGAKQQERKTFSTFLRFIVQLRFFSAETEQQKQQKCVFDAVFCFLLFRCVEETNRRNVRIRNSYRLDVRGYWTRAVYRMYICVCDVCMSVLNSRSVERIMRFVDEDDCAYMLLMPSHRLFSFFFSLLDRTYLCGRSGLCMRPNVNLFVDSHSIICDVLRTHM